MFDASKVETPYIPVSLMLIISETGVHIDYPLLKRTAKYEKRAGVFPSKEIGQTLDVLKRLNRMRFSKEELALGLLSDNLVDRWLAKHIQRELNEQEET